MVPSVPLRQSKIHHGFFALRQKFLAAMRLFCQFNRRNNALFGEIRRISRWICYGIGRFWKCQDCQDYFLAKQANACHNCLVVIFVRKAVRAVFRCRIVGAVQERPCKRRGTTLLELSLPLPVF
jgi:hypothetical protein